MEKLIKDGMRYQLAEHNAIVSATSALLSQHILPDLADIIGEYLWLDNAPLPMHLITVCWLESPKVHSPCGNFWISTTIGFRDYCQHCCVEMQNLEVKLGMYDHTEMTHYQINDLWKIFLSDYHKGFPALVEYIADEADDIMICNFPQKNWMGYNGCLPVVNDMLLNICRGMISEARKAEHR